MKGKGRARSRTTRSPSPALSVEQPQASQPPASQPQPIVAQENDVDIEVASVTSVASTASQRGKKIKLHSFLTEEEEHSIYGGLAGRKPCVLQQEDECIQRHGEERKTLEREGRRVGKRRSRAQDMVHKPSDPLRPLEEEEI